MSTAPINRTSLARRSTVGLLAVLLAYGLAELAAFMALPSLAAEATSSIDLEAPDLRAGRERAGLGMRDAAMSLHPYFGYVYTPKAPGEEPGRIAISPEGFLDDAQPIRKRNDERLLVGLVGGSVAGQLGTWYSDGLRDALLARDELGAEAVEFVRLGMPGYHNRSSSNNSRTSSPKAASSTC